MIVYTHWRGSAQASQAEREVARRAGGILRPKGDMPLKRHTISPSQIASNPQFDSPL